MSLKSTNNFLSKLKAGAKVLWADYFDQIATVKTQLNDVEKVLRDTLDMLIAHQFADDPGSYQWQALCDSLEDLETELVGNAAEARGVRRGIASASASVSNGGGGGGGGDGVISGSDAMET